MPPFTIGTPHPSGVGDTSGPMHGDLGLQQGQGLQVTLGSSNSVSDSSCSFLFFQQSAPLQCCALPSSCGGYNMVRTLPSGAFVHSPGLPQPRRTAFAPHALFLPFYFYCREQHSTLHAIRALYTTRIRDSLRIRASYGYEPRIMNRTRLVNSSVYKARFG